MRKILIVGGGAAGLMAARSAAISGGSDAQITILEHMEKCGRKIYITGKGRCNATNDCTRDEFLREVPRNPRFLYAALAALSPQRLMDDLEEMGCPVTVQRGRRVFPASEKASDVTRALTRDLERRGVQVQLHADVQHLLLDGDTCRGVRLASGHEIPADAVIVATGGLSASGTGSTGDGYRLAREAGHTVTPLRPSLSALESDETWMHELQGLSLQHVELSARTGKKTIYREEGEMLFTHFGISGPLVLELSSHLPDDPCESAIFLNLKPALTPEQLDARLLREIQGQERRQLGNLLCALLPSRFAAVFPSIIDLDPRKPAGELTQEERHTLAGDLQQLPLHVTGYRTIQEAIVTRGGVSVREINPSTMESRLVHGLYFAGEVMDVDAHTGGYNLHIAFSTGFLAGQHAVLGA